MTKKRKIFMCLSFFIIIHLVTNIFFYVLSSDGEEEEDWSFSQKMQMYVKSEEGLKQKEGKQLLDEFDLELGPGFQMNVTVKKDTNVTTGSNQNHTRHLNHSNTSDTNSPKTLLDIYGTQDTHQQHHRQHVINNQT